MNIKFVDVSVGEKKSMPVASVVEIIALEDGTMEIETEDSLYWTTEITFESQFS